MINREREVSDAFVSLATGLARGEDVIDLVTDLTLLSARLLDIASAGLLLANERGVLHLLAASSDRTRDLEIFQLQRNQGPCLDCYATATAVSVENLIVEAYRWPQFALAALEAGFRSVHAVPLRFGDNVIGTLGLFGTSVGILNDDDQRLGQAFADVASIAIIQDRTAADDKSLNVQLQAALDSRVAIEQSKGLLAQLGDVDMESAFQLLRRYARDHNQRLSDVAMAIATRQLPGRVIFEHAEQRDSRPQQ